MQQTTRQAAPRRIPSTQEDLDLITTIAGHAHPGATVVKACALVPTGALISICLGSSENLPRRVVRLLDASGYTARDLGDLTIAVTGVISRLEILQAERDRLNAEIAAEEERQRAAIAAA